MVSIRIKKMHIPSQTDMQALYDSKLLEFPSQPPKWNSWHLPVAGLYLQRGIRARQCPLTGGSLHTVAEF